MGDPRDRLPADNAPKAGDDFSTLPAEGVAAPADETDDDDKDAWALGMWIAIGMGLGAALGLALDNLGIGIALGIVFGGLIGATKMKDD